MSVERIARAVRRTRRAATMTRDAAQSTPLSDAMSTKDDVEKLERELAGLELEAKQVRVHLIFVVSLLPTSSSRMKGATAHIATRV